MDKFIIFASHNTILVIAIIVVSLMLIHSLIGEKLKGYSSITPSQSTQLINRDNAMVLDVRENNEYGSGHIINSIHIPLSNIKSRIGELDKYKNQKVIVACRSGHRSSHACASLKKEGFEQVFNLSGGVMAWENANLPLVKK